MDHHHHHRHPSHPHPHLQGHGSRYGPLPPHHPTTAPVLLPPDPFRRQPHLSFPPPPLTAALPPPATAAHHHHRLDSGGVVYISYASSSSHASDDRGRLLAPVDPPDRLVVKAPHPPLPVLRVSERIIFPEGHPEAPRVHNHPRRSGGGDAFIREDFKRERVRVLDDGQGGPPYGRREGEALELAEQEDAARRFGLPGRKRPRWEEGRSLGEDSLLECFVQGMDHPKRLTSGTSTNRRRCGVVYDFRPVDSESSRGSTSILACERGDAVFAFPRLPADVPLRSSVYSLSKQELLGKSPMMESETLALSSSHAFREKNFTGRGNRHLFGGEEEVLASPKKPPQQKPSVLSRIQYAKPVYKRKSEQQIMASASTLPVSQTSAFSEGKQFERDVPVKLDVSFKSDVLVAKEILSTPVSASLRSTGQICGARTAMKNVAKVTTAFPSTSFSLSDSKLSTMQTHKMKSREERFAQFSPGEKLSKERTPRNKMTNKVLASSNNVAQSFDDKVICPRSPRKKVANEILISPNPLQNSAGVSPVRMTEKKMAEKVVAPLDTGVQSHDGKTAPTWSPKRKPAKEILVHQNHAMPNSNDRVPTVKPPKLLNSDVMITAERCPEDKLAREILVNSTVIEVPTGGMVSNTEGTGKKLANETLVDEKAVSLHCNDKVTSVSGPKKEVLDNISFPPVSVVPNGKENTIIERLEEKSGKDAFISLSSLVNSDKKITPTKTLRRKIIKKNKKKKVVTSMAPCLSSVDPPEEISKGCVLTSSSLKEIEPSKKIQLASTMSYSHMEQRYLKEENTGMRHSETVEKASILGSSCEDSKDLEDIHAKSLSGYPEGMASTTVRSPKKELINEKNMVEFTLIPCALDSRTTQETCEMPMPDNPYDKLLYSKEVKSESLSNCFQKDLTHSEEVLKDKLHREEVHQDRLDSGVHSGFITDSYPDVGHLENVHDGSTKTTDFQGKGQGRYILTSWHNDVTRPVFKGKAETDDVGNINVDNSSLELHLQRIMLPRHLDTNIIEASSNAMVPLKVDIDEGPKKKSSTEIAAGDFKSSIQEEESRGDGNVNFGEDFRSGKHLSASEKTFPPDTASSKKVHNECTAFFDGESSLKSDITSSNRDGTQKFSPCLQSSAVLEEPAMVLSEKDAATVLHCPMQGRSVCLQVEAQTAIPELERERNKCGEVDSDNDIVGGERSGELNADVLALSLEGQDAISGRNLLMETDGQDGGVLHLPFIDLFPQSSPSMIRVDGPVINFMAEQLDDTVHSSPLDISEGNSPEDLATASEEIHFTEVKQANRDILDNKGCHGGSTAEKLYGNSSSKNDYLSYSKTLPIAELKISGKSDLINLTDCLISGKTLPQQTQESEKQLNKSHQLAGKETLTGTKVCQRPGISKVFPNQKDPSTRTFKKPPSHGIRHNKWYRTENSPISSSSGQMKWLSRSSLPRQSPKKLGKIQSSYIRKGNSLIRKSSPAIPSSHRYPEQTALDQVHLPETNKNMTMEDKIASTDCLSFSNARTLNSTFERPKTPPLPLSTKSSHPSLSSLQTLREDPHSELGGEDNAIPSVGTQGFDLSEENHCIVVSEESKASGKRKLVYVKHRSNQLIAAPAMDANSTSDHTTEESPALPFALPDIYYRNKNKLIRDMSLSDAQLKQEISLPIDCSGAKCHGQKNGAKVPRKRRLEKAMEKTYKQSRFSLVWTLNGTQSQNNKRSNVLKHQNVLPYLFPWKRTTYWRDFITKMGSNWSKHSPSLIRKLQLCRHRGTIYTIANSGFSLRKYGVLSVGGSNLKWSKSMEKHSRKSSEEATLAILEQESKKKNHKHTTCADIAMESGSCSQRERIFRVGNIRYKMDSSRRTLVRIPDEQMPSVASSQPVHGAKMSIVPRRLLIGNDEYIRVGNGNQLVRDPKKLVRILANEKIRWSLHTARLRSVRRQQYCQFFTRFGKCNKENGKCPYIHDPTKIAICTKFLKGLCSSSNCKLTHKVIPERMPDCSYFLLGLCTNMNCPYRHVNVNPKAPVCEGFLKGYCRDGDECCKKHTYVCPYFEATGECHQGSACKLHHPKCGNKQANKSRKKKHSPTHDHGRGRYFGCSVAEVGKSQVFTSNTDVQKKDEDIFYHEGRFAEYIHLDVDSDDDVMGLSDLMDSHPTLMDSDLSDSRSCDADALIKPMCIMKVDPR